MSLNKSYPSPSSSASSGSVAITTVLSSRRTISKIPIRPSKSSQRRDGSPPPPLPLHTHPNTVLIPVIQVTPPSPVLVRKRPDIGLEEEEKRVKKQRRCGVVIVPPTPPPSPIGSPTTAHTAGPTLPFNDPQVIRDSVSESTGYVNKLCNIHRFHSPPPVPPPRTFQLTRIPSYSNFGIAGKERLSEALPGGIEYPRYAVMKRNERLAWVRGQSKKLAKEAVGRGCSGVGGRVRCTSLPGASVALPLTLMPIDSLYTEERKNGMRCPHDGCDRIFVGGGSHEAELKAHLKVHLNFARTFVCFRCRRAYETRKELDIHACPGASSSSNVGKADKVGPKIRRVPAPKCD